MNLEKIDFKTSKEKKHELKRNANEKGVTVTYIMNCLLDDYLNGNTKMIKKQEFAFHLTKLLQGTKYLNEGEAKELVVKEAEELLCLML